MIRNFRHKGLQRLFETGNTAGVSHTHVEKLTRILTALDRATGPQEMDHPTFRLHPLKGGRRGFWSVTVAANWRLTFSFDERHDAVEVNYEDYH